MNHNDQNTQEHFLRKTNIKRVLTPLISIFIITFFSITTNASLYFDSVMEDDISDASLIISGKFISKYVQYEEFVINMKNKDGEIKKSIPKSIYTTFTFSVDEILKGSYPRSEIKVKMIGGCLPNNGDCDKYSFGFDYATNEKAVLFLKYYEKYKYYYVSKQSKTAFSIIDNNLLIEKSLGEDESNKSKSNYISYDKNGIATIKHDFNIQLLKEMIDKEKEGNK